MAAVNSSQMLMAAGTIGKGAADMMYAQSQAKLAMSDAESERDAAAQQAKLILQATQRRRSEARAATAGSGAKIDAFSLANEQEILQAGETDAAMAILSGNRKARGLEIGAGYQKAAGLNSLSGSLFSTAAQMKGWKGTKAPTSDNGRPYNDRTGSGD